MKPRASTPIDKSEVLKRILTAWLAVPELRLGQFIANADIEIDQLELFYISDADLVAALEEFANAHPR